MVVDPIPQTIEVIKWLVPTLLIVFIIPRFSRWGGQLAKEILHLGQ